MNIFDGLLERERDWSSSVLLVLFILCFLVKYFLGKKLSSVGIRKETNSQKIEGKISLTDLAKKHKEESYEEMMKEFEYEYDRTNPVTSELKTKEYFELVQSKIEPNRRHVRQQIDLEGCEQSSGQYRGRNAEFFRGDF